MKTQTFLDSWEDRHREALEYPRNDHELAIGLLFRGLQTYVVAHQERFDSSLSEDYILSPEWVAMAKAFLQLLNGETGRLDCDTMDSTIRKLAAMYGFTLDDD